MYYRRVGESEMGGLEKGSSEAGDGESRKDARRSCEFEDGVGWR